MSLVRPYKLEIPVRLIFAALLHSAYLYFVYKYQWFGVRGQVEPLLLIGVTCAVGIAAVAPVIWFGDMIERAMAGVLLISPVCWEWHVVHEIFKLWAV